MSELIQLTLGPIDKQQLVGQVYHPEDGAVVTFEGIVRNHADGLAVRYLEYEAFEEMAKAQLRIVLEEVQARWGLTHVAVVHRLGRMEIGDMAVLVVVGAPHRNEAFQACHYVIDRIKETVPIWKKEHYADDAVWKG